MLEHAIERCRILWTCMNYYDSWGSTSRGVGDCLCCTLDAYPDFSLSAAYWVRQLSMVNLIATYNNLHWFRPFLRNFNCFDCFAIKHQSKFNDNWFKKNVFHWFLYMSLDFFVFDVLGSLAGWLWLALGVGVEALPTHGVGDEASPRHPYAGVRRTERSLSEVKGSI